MRGDIMRAMGSWAMARRAAEACASSVVGGAVAAEAAAGSSRVSTAIAYVRFPASRTFHHFSQRLTLFSSDASSSSSSSGSPLSTSCASPSEASIGFRRPEEIPWQKDLANSVCLIGHIHHIVDIRYLDSGKIVASTAIRVKRFPFTGTEGSVFYLQFWDELAEIAAAHLKKEDHVYIAGSVWVENYVDKDDLQRSICKKNPKFPDFKHKSTGIGLWIDDKRNPIWVFDRLEQGRPKLEENSEGGPREDKLKEMEKLWQAFFANPSDWWDNRDTKKNAKFPDFKNKTNGDALWIEGYYNPSWVKSQLQAMDSKVKIAKEGGGRVIGLKDKTSFEDKDLGFF